MSDNQGNIQTLDIVLKNALKVPGVKVDRRKFLINNFSENIDAKNLDELLAIGPIEYGVSRDLIEKKANKILANRTLKSSAISFGLGLPGGIAMAGSIPGDIAQFFSESLIIAQELAYLFGFDDLLKDDTSVIENREMMLFLGTMFGVSGSSAVLKTVSSKVAQQVAKKLPQKALTKTFYYPIIKKIGAIMGAKVTKNSFAKATSKVVPVVGGVISGGLTFASLSKMGKRLKETLIESAYDYTEQDYMKDYDEIVSTFNQKESSKKAKMFEAEFTEVDEKVSSNRVDTNNNTIVTSIADELLKLNDLVDKDIITEEEFKELKSKILQKA